MGRLWPYFGIEPQWIDLDVGLWVPVRNKTVYVISGDLGCYTKWHHFFKPFMLQMAVKLPQKLRNIFLFEGKFSFQLVGANVTANYFQENDFRKINISNRIFTAIFFSWKFRFLGIVASNFYRKLVGIVSPTNFQSLVNIFLVVLSFYHSAFARLFVQIIWLRAQFLNNPTKNNSYW